MDQNFQTSFIPKKPLAEDRAPKESHVSIFTVLAFLVFFSFLVVSGGLYFWKATLTKSIDDMSASLDRAKERFEPSKISQLQIMDKRLSAANELLSNHIAISPILESLSNLTLKTVRYTKFGYEISPEGDKINVKMGGQATNYRSIALQSNLFGKNKFILNPIFSNLSLDEKGNVLFDLSFSVSRLFVSFKSVAASSLAQ